MSVHVMPEYCLAVCKDRPQEQACYSVYFINNSPYEIKDLRYETGGFATCDDEVVMLQPHTRRFGDLAPQSYIKIEEDDEEDFAYLLSYTFLFTVDGSEMKRDFQIGKRLAGGYRYLFEPMPYLNKPGWMFK